MTHRSYAVSLTSYFVMSRQTNALQRQLDRKIEEFKAKEEDRDAKKKQLTAVVEDLLRKVRSFTACLWRPACGTLSSLDNPSQHTYHHMYIYMYIYIGTETYLVGNVDTFVATRSPLPVEAGVVGGLP